MKKVFALITTCAVLLTLSVVGVFGPSSAHAAAKCYMQNPAWSTDKSKPQYIDYTGSCSDGAGTVVNESGNGCYIATAVGLAPVDCATINSASGGLTAVDGAQCFSLGQSVPSAADPNKFERQLSITDPVSGQAIALYTREACSDYANPTSGFTGVNASAKGKCYVIELPPPAAGQSKAAKDTPCSVIVAAALQALTARATIQQNKANSAAASQWQADNLSDVAANGGDLTQNPIYKTLLMILNFLSAGVFMVIAGVIVSAGIQYSAARENPQIVSAAKLRIWNAVLAALVYIFMYGILQWVVPGGIFAP